METIAIDANLCAGCGLCSEVCPHKIFKRENSQTLIRDERRSLCFGCGHCMMVCPSKAVSVGNHAYGGDIFDLPGIDRENANFFDLIQTRRAVRNFKDKPVPRELLEKIAQAIAFAPPGFPPLRLEITIVQNKELIQKSLKYMIEDYDFLYRGMQNPLMRFFIRKQAGNEKFKALNDHVIPMMKHRLPGLMAGTEDTIIRGAPAMILFHADKNETLIEEDVHIAATFGFLAAHSLGLGGSAMSLIYPDVDRNKKIRDLFAIPAENKVAGSIIVGYPKYAFKRGIKRQLKSITWL